MAKSFSLDDYKDVAERIEEFYERYPEGRLCRKGDPEVKEIGNKVFIVYTALAYRDPLDRQPAMGTAWEPFPGTTPYTRDSELMNAETAAWGRAIIAAGISSRKDGQKPRIASRQEVRNRQAPKVETIGKDVAEALKGALTGFKAGEIRSWLTASGAQNVQDVAAAIESLTPEQADAFGKYVDDARTKAAA